ncbi:PucR family transcriptional regulator [Amycolatopsis nigrescens]|uniref:PucR family transcriptional regulator n=1 Tax=Amycolatopsis nigrescens TaxID=381445 RepID=UPI0012FA13FD|nr:helix-turn-helix domain-containing protein [Amycolatopsis nigrescens]
MTALLPRVDEIAAAVVLRCAEEIPAYRLLPASVIESDLVANTKAVLELFFSTVAEGRAPTDRELELPVTWGSERARDGLPLDAVLRMYPLGAQEAWRLANETTDPARRLELLDMVGRLLDFLAIVLPQVAAAYLRERDDLDWERREGRQNLASTLLAGRPAERAAERSGRGLAERYRVVVFHLPELPADTSTRATTDRFRSIQHELDAEQDVLTTFERDGGVLLVPAGQDGQAGQDRRARAEVARLLGRIDKAAGTRCAAGAATADGHAGIPAAHDEATEVLNLAEQLGRPPGIHWLADLAIEYQIAQPGPARASLARILAPLDAHPHLLDALRSFINTGYNRGEAATALTIHRNTLTYRLGRIQTITGYDATRAEDARQLAAAMTAYDITRKTGHPAS